MPGEDAPKLLVDFFIKINMSKKPTHQVKTFVEYTPDGKKVEVKRFYYPPEEVWLCIECYHVGREVILATVPCESCEKGITQVSIK